MRKRNLHHSTRFLMRNRNGLLLLLCKHNEYQIKVPHRESSWGLLLLLCEQRTIFQIRNKLGSCYGCAIVLSTKSRYLIGKRAGFWPMQGCCWWSMRWESALIDKLRSSVFGRFASKIIEVPASCLRRHLASRGVFGKQQT